MPLNIAGAFYPSFTSNLQLFSDADKGCIQRTVDHLLSIQTSAERPGMLLGKIQSGKTKTFLASISLAFDNGFDIAIILTKGTKALARQTLARVRREFLAFHQNDKVQILDIMTVPAGLTGYELNQKIIFVVKKQSDNLNRLTAVFRETYPQLARKRALLIDDEADFASIGFRNSPKEGVLVNVTARQIDQLRETLATSAFLQVTATPYSLYLQPEEFIVNGIEFRPIRPAFTELVPVRTEYVGSDYYFERSQEQNSVASLIYRPVTPNELGILRSEDRRSFRIEECLTSTAIPVLRRAIMNFIVGGCVRRLQDSHANLTPKKYSFLVHTETGRAAHTWQERVVNMINEKLQESAESNPDLLRALIRESYEDLSASIRVLSHHLPTLEAITTEVFTALTQGWLMITKVNSERQVEQLLDDEGQLRLRTPLNIFIGGQILDRGVTIVNLIGFYYGRRPQIFQQDTVLQHSRMFGFRPIEDLTVTRFYTEPAIHLAMRRMHESDVALRDNILRSPDQAVRFIQRDAAGRIIPCSPNKILISNTTTLKPFKRILPIGFQTDYRTRVFPIIQQIDRAIEQIIDSQDPEAPFRIPLQTGIDMLRRIEPTLILEEDMGYTFDWEAFCAALTYMSNQAEDQELRGQIWCMVRKDRKIRRFQPALGSPFFSDAPDTAQREGVVAKQVAVDIPILLLIRQDGLEEHGWRGTPFYWPVLMAQQGIKTSIFAHETNP